MAKKTNFITYELKRLEGYLSSLTQFLDDHPPHLMEDRVELMTSTTGNPILKVISSREAQLKAYRDTLEGIPKILTALNDLRKSVDDEEPQSVRGGLDIPGFMQGRTGKVVEDIGFEEVPNSRKRKDQPFEDDDEGVNEGATDGVNDGESVEQQEEEIQEVEEQEDIVEAEEEPANDTLALPPSKQEPKKPAGKMKLGEEIDFTEDDDDDW